MSHRKQILKDMMAAISSGVSGASSGFFADGLEWTNATASPVTMNKAQFLGIMEKMLSVFVNREFGIRPIRMIEEGDSISVEAESLGIMKEGPNYNNRYNFVFEFEGDRIIRVREYNDSAHVVAVLGPVLNSDILLGHEAQAGPV